MEKFRILQVSYLSWSRSDERKVILNEKEKRATTTTTKSLESCPTLCDPIDGSPPGSTVPGIL